MIKQENNYIDIWDIAGKKKIYSLSDHSEIVTYVVRKKLCEI